MRQYIDVLQDNSGNAITNGTVKVLNYPSGTLASIFSDNGLTPIGTSIVATDATGAISFFVADGDYTLQFFANSLLYKTQSPVSVFDGAAQVTMQDTGAVNAYAISGSNLEKALRTGLRCAVKIAHTNTDVSTLQYNTLAAKPIILSDGTALTASLLSLNGIYLFEYNGTSWQVLTAISAPGLSTYIRASQHRGTYTLPGSVYFFGDSFFEQPNGHTSSGNSMAFKAAALLGVTGVISATSGNTSADKQGAIFARIPAATDISVIGLGQNDAQFVGTGADQEQRLDDIALIQLANAFQISVPSGSRRILASAMTQAGTWAADGDIAEGGALVSTTNASALQAQLSDSRFVVIIAKIKTGSSGLYSVIIDGTTFLGSLDGGGFRGGPIGNIPTNTGQTYARIALVFDGGRRKPLTTVQVVVTSTTGAGNAVSICSVMGLAGEAPSGFQTGPLASLLDLSDRGAAGYATSAGSQIALPKVSRITGIALSIAGAAGGRMVPVAISTVINPSTDLDVDQFHPNENGAINAAQAMATAIQNAAQDWSVQRPDLDAQSLLNGADGYVLLAGTVLMVDADFKWKRTRVSAAKVDFDQLIPNGLVGAIRPQNDGGIQLGSISLRFSSLWLSGNIKIGRLQVSQLPSAATFVDCLFIVTDANATTPNSIVAGGGANIMLVKSDGTNWRIV